MDSYEWLAGLLEGEGSFLAGPPSDPGKPRVVLAMGDEDVVRRAANLLGVRRFGKQVFTNPKWKPCYRFNVSGQRAVDLMIRIRPMMGVRRQAQIDKAVACWNPPWIRNRERDVEILARWNGGGVSYADIGRAMGLTGQLVREVIRRRQGSRSPVSSVGEQRVHTAQARGSNP